METMRLDRNGDDCARGLRLCGRENEQSRRLAGTGSTADSVGCAARRLLITMCVYGVNSFKGSFFHGCSTVINDGLHFWRCTKPFSVALSSLRGIDKSSELPCRARDGRLSHTQLATIISVLLSFRFSRTSQKAFYLFHLNEVVAARREYRALGTRHVVLITPKTLWYHET